MIACISLARSTMLDMDRDRCSCHPYQFACNRRPESPDEHGFPEILASIATVTVLDFRDLRGNACRRYICLQSQPPNKSPFLVVSPVIVPACGAGSPHARILQARRRLPWRVRRIGHLSSPIRHRARPSADFCPQRRTPHHVCPPPRVSRLIQPGAAAGTVHNRLPNIMAPSTAIGVIDDALAQPATPDIGHRQ